MTYKEEFDVTGPASTIQAQQTAESLLCDDLPARWAHVQRVAATAEDLALDLAQRDALDPEAVTLAVTAAWLHDLGYARGLITTGFHPLDGAMWLREHGWSPDVTGLVAHHSLAIVEATRRGVDGELRDFVDEPGLVRDVLWVADATSGPTGEVVTINARLTDVIARYGPDHLVSQCMVDVAAAALAAQQRLEARCVDGAGDRATA